MRDIIAEQKELCAKYGAEYYPSREDFKIGIADGALLGDLPVNGLRHISEAGTTGWYIWGGEYSDADNFFKPYHVHHIQEILPVIEKYLGLSPGWRFLTDGKYEDVWFDMDLLSTP